MYMDDRRKVKVILVRTGKHAPPRRLEAPKEFLKPVSVPPVPLAPPEPVDDFTCYFDGSCGPINPGGKARYGWLIKDERGEVVAFESRHIGTGQGMTNNVAEYAGLYCLLRFIQRNNLLGHFRIQGDSLMVVNMATKRWGRKNPHKDHPHLLAWLLPIHQMLAEPIDGQKYSVAWIEREKNQEADTLSNLSYDYVPPEVDSRESHHEPFPHLIGNS
jgi:ribonuclease HI